MRTLATRCARLVGWGCVAASFACSDPVDPTGSSSASGTGGSAVGGAGGLGAGGSSTTESTTATSGGGGAGASGGEGGTGGSGEGGAPGCEVFAEGDDLVGIVDLAVGDGHLFILTEGRFDEGYVGAAHACPLDDCSDGPTVLASNQPQPGELAVRGSDVYWTSYADITTPNAGGIARCATSGCGGAPTMLVRGYGPWHLTLDAASVYFTQVQQSGVATCPLAGCATPTLLATVAAPWDVVLDGDTLYFTNQWPNAPNYGRLRRCDVADCSTPEDLVSGLEFPGELVVRDGIAYWANYEAIWTCPVDDCAANLTELAAAQNNPRDLVADDAFLYWTNVGANAGEGSVVRCAIAGCAGNPEPIADALDYPYAVAVDASFVYFALYGLGASGSVVRCPQPDAASR